MLHGASHHHCVHGAYRCVQKMAQLHRTGPGTFEQRMTDRELDNFPLVNVTHPDLSRHPLYRDSSVFTIEVYAQHVHGMCTACARHVHGMCTACARHVHGMCVQLYS